MHLGAGTGDGSGPPPGVKPGAVTALLAELKRRHVFRVMVGYGIFAFAALQVAEPLMHPQAPGGAATSLNDAMVRAADLGQMGRSLVVA